MWNPNTEMSEDCLYLNIWQPERGSVKKAVMVWIYGGGFISGTSTLTIYDGDILASVGDVVVVTFQYRVGPFGFLSLGSHETAGNAGLMDQNLAIKWVHDNIQSFGGDKDRITLFGESAGAASVSYHLISPMSRDLFKYGILMSASVPGELNFVSPFEAKQRGLDLASKVGCNITKTTSAIECLMKADARLISKQQWNILNINAIFPYSFVPTIDGKFLTKHPKDYLEQGDFKKTSVLAGVTSDEGSYFLAYYFLRDKRMQNGTEVPILSVGQFADDVRVVLNNANDSLVNYVIKVYGSPNSSNAYRGTLERMIGDKGFKCPVERLAKRILPSKSARVLLRIRAQDIGEPVGGLDGCHARI